jgi:hypothetical protein
MISLVELSLHSPGQTTKYGRKTRHIILYNPTKIRCGCFPETSLGHTTTPSFAVKWMLGWLWASGTDSKIATSKRALGMRVSVWHKVPQVDVFWVVTSSSPWRWKQHGPLKRWYPNATLHDVTTLNTTAWNITAVKAPQLTLGMFRKPLRRFTVSIRTRVYWKVSGLSW